MQYAQTSSNLWSFVLSAPDANSYIAIGFSSNGVMIGSSAVVGWISATDGSPTVKKYFLGGQNSKEVVLDGGNLVINTSMIVTQSSRLYLAFQLNTDQPAPRIIYALGPTGVMPSSPSFSLTRHADMVSTTLNYVTGKNRQAIWLILFFSCIICVKYLLINIVQCALVHEPFVNTTWLVLLSICQEHAIFLT